MGLRFVPQGLQGIARVFALKNVGPWFTFDFEWLRARLGEHGHPRMDTSEHVYFANDQLAVRFIEEIDFDYAANDATAVLLTAAS